MGKYYIIPKANWEDTVEANSAEEAIVNFATSMDMDMNIYFDVVSEEDYYCYKLKRSLEEDKMQYVEFATEILLDDFCEYHFNKEEANALAEDAWSLYCGDKKGAEGFTEYECIEKAVDDWEEKTQPD